MTERDLLLDCLRRLNRLDIDYMLTGSMASNFWGVPRTTHDLDFVVRFQPHQASLMVRAFDDQFFIQERSVQAAFEAPYQFNALDRRSGLKVDFWMLREDAFEQEMFRRRRRETLFDEPAWIATAEDVILHKLHWHRLTPSERQVMDAAGVVAVQAERLDHNYLTLWASRLGLSEILAELLSGRRRPKST